ncbi:MAG: Kelch repeat-containing protein [Parashewanella sp.]
MSNKFFLILATLFFSMPFQQAHANIDELPLLPMATTNNAVTQVNSNGTHYLLSFMGLGKGKTFRDIHNKAWLLPLAPSTSWQALPDVPHVEKVSGRLASIAIGINQNAYIFGGYTVDKNHHEVSTNDNYRFDVTTRKYTRIADMPVAVDDTAAIQYQDRYIYLFSGWHQTSNVNLVQVYDTHTNKWAQATPLPIAATFGLAVGAVDNKLVLCDGVKIKINEHKKREFVSSPMCLFGEIDPNNHLNIDWRSLPHYSTASPTTAPLKAHYRMAAAGVKQAGKLGQIYFIGGSDNPYNYNGIGYNGKPSQPSSNMFRFDLASHRWITPIKVNKASMDHRGLLIYKQNLIRIGGMTEHQHVTNQVIVDPLPKL